MIRRPRPTERQTQRAILQHLALAFPRAVVFAVPNGGSRNTREAAEMKSDGVRAGAPDLIVLHAGRCIGLEVKRPGGGRGQAHQKAFGRAMREAGGAWVCVQSVEEAVAAVKESVAA